MHILNFRQQPLTTEQLAALAAAFSCTVEAITVECVMVQIDPSAPLYPQVVELLPESVDAETLINPPQDLVPVAMLLAAELLNRLGVVNVIHLRSLSGAQVEVAEVLQMRCNRGVVALPVAGLHVLESLQALQSFLRSLPEGTGCTVSACDLPRGNFTTARFDLPDGSTREVVYRGLVDD